MVTAYQPPPGVWPKVCCLEGGLQGPALACLRNVKGTHMSLGTLWAARGSEASVGCPDMARGLLYEAVMPCGLTILWDKTSWPIEQSRDSLMSLVS
jgi:hypothetical protein